MNTTPKFCGFCGASLESGAFFCGECGTAIDQFQESSTKQSSFNADSSSSTQQPGHDCRTGSSCRQETLINNSQQNSIAAKLAWIFGFLLVLVVSFVFLGTTRMIGIGLPELVIAAFILLFIIVKWGKAIFTGQKKK